MPATEAPRMLLVMIREAARAGPDPARREARPRRRALSAA
jgi:hypothetical protein